MSEVDRLFDQYIALYRSGDSADPTAFVEQLEGVNRRELEALIDGFLRSSLAEPGRRRPTRGLRPSASSSGPSSRWQARLAGGRSCCRSCASERS